MYKDWIVILSPTCHFCIQQFDILKKLGLTNYYTVSNGAIVGKGNPQGDYPYNVEFRGYPAWYNYKTKGIKYGLQSASDLAKL